MAPAEGVSHVPFNPSFCPSRSLPHPRGPPSRVRAPNPRGQASVSEVASGERPSSLGFDGARSGAEGTRATP